MAYGRPGKGAAFLYLGFALGGLAIILCVESFWVRSFGVVALVYSLFCLLLTGAFLELLPATPATQRGRGWSRESNQANGDIPAPGKRERSADPFRSEPVTTIETPSEHPQQGAE
jgi:hypothetical protein